MLLLSSPVANTRSSWAAENSQPVNFDIVLDSDIDRMPWNIRRASEHVHAHCSTLFLHVASFLCRGVMVPDKALSFHAQAVSCFNKGKSTHGLEFGHAF
jgi:hypothetical protein